MQWKILGMRMLLVAYEQYFGKHFSGVFERAHPCTELWSWPGPGHWDIDIIHGVVSEINSSRQFGEFQKNFYGIDTSDESW
jgi:hypothetical protein